MVAAIAITPHLPAAKTYSGIGRWLSCFPVVRKTLQQMRIEELESLEEERLSVEYGVCDFLNRHYLELEKHWGMGDSFSPQPFLITAEGLSHLENHFGLRTATEDQLAVARSELSESEFFQAHGFNSNELFQRKLEYLTSIAPDEIVHFDSSRHFDFGTWGVVVSYLSDKPAFACVGITRKPTDHLLRERNSEIGVLKPVWDRELSERQQLP